MSSNLDAFIKRMDNLAVVYSRSPSDVATASARAYTTSIRREINAAAPGGRMRNVGKKGARVGAKYNVVGSAGSAKAFVQATGPLHLLERNTARHDIPKTRSSRQLRTAAGRRSAKREDTGRQLSGSVFLGSKDRHFTAMGPVSHPGTRGKHPFERGIRNAERQAVAEAIGGLRKAISGAFRG